jgi:hypothetical protein
MSPQVVNHVALLCEFARAILSLAEQKGVQSPSLRVNNSFFEIKLTLELFKFDTLKRILPANLILLGTSLVLV